MTTLETMYAPQANSPATSTASALTQSGTSVTVLDGSVLPAAPMLLVLGGDTTNPETVLMTAKNGDVLTITRAVEGSAKAWGAGTLVARMFTAKDLKAVQNNIVALNNDKAPIGSVPAATTTSPKMDGSAAVGSETAYAKGDHVHPADTSKQDKIMASGLLKGDGNGGVTAAVVGSDYAPPSAIPSSYGSTPNMDGTGSAGSSSNYSRGDHTHPTDTSRQAKITASGLLKGDGNGGVTAAVVGTDYQTPLTAGTDYVTPATLGNYIPSSEKGAASGVATLDSDGKVTPNQTSAKMIAVTANRTLSASDAGCFLYVTGTRTITIPNSLTAGTEIEIMNYGTGTVTVVAASGVTLNGASAGSKTIDSQYTSAVLKAITATAWVIQGAIA